MNKKEGSTLPSIHEVISQGKQAKEKDGNGMRERYDTGLVVYTIETRKIADASAE